MKLIHQNSALFCYVVNCITCVCVPIMLLSLICQGTQWGTCVCVCVCVCITSRSGSTVY